jgi:hypothetical protein
MFQALKAGMEPSPRAGELRPVVLDYLAKAWREPNEGIWEVRGGPQHFVHSKVMAWVAFDRAASDAQAFGESAPRWRKIADEIHARSASAASAAAASSGLRLRQLDSGAADPDCRLCSRGRPARQERFESRTDC